MNKDFARAVQEMRDPRIYERIPGRVVFVENKRKTADGKVVEVGKKELEEIARTSNQRDANGDPCLLALGHTLRGQQPETSQPVPVGYAREFQVRWLPERRKWGITSTYYIRKSDLPYARTFPRTSVEYWGAEGGERFFDPISLIRRTPELDIGQWTYSATCEPLRYSRTVNGRTATVLRYEFEEKPLDDPLNAADAGAGAGAAAMTPDNGAEEYERHAFGHPGAADYYAKKCAQYAMGSEEPPVPPTEPPAAEPTAAPDAFAAVAPTATSEMPGPVKEREEYARRQRDQAALQFTRYEARLKALEEKDRAKDAEIARYQRDAEAQKYERQMIQLEAEGADINRADEMKFVMELPATALRESYMSRLASRPRAPVQQFGRITPALAPATSTGSPESEARRQMQVLQFQRDNPKMSWSDAEEKCPANYRSGTMPTYRNGN